MFRTSREGECFSWLFLVRLTINLPCLMVACLMLPGLLLDTGRSQQGLPFVIKLKVGKSRVWMTSWGRGTQDTASVLLLVLGPKEFAFFSSFRVLPWLSLALFPVFIVVFCRVELGKMVYGILSGPEAGFYFFFLSCQQGGKGVGGYWLGLTLALLGALRFTL